MNLDQIVNAIAFVENLKGAPLLILFLLAMGWIAKLVPVIDNKFIPAIVVVAGTGLYPFMVAKDALPKYLPAPYLIVAMYGFIFGVATWLLHHYAVAHIEDKILSLFGKKNTTPPTPPNP